MIRTALEELSRIPHRVGQATQSLADSIGREASGFGFALDYSARLRTRFLRPGADKHFSTSCTIVQGERTTDTLYFRETPLSVTGVVWSPSKHEGYLFSTAIDSFFYGNVFQRGIIASSSLLWKGVLRIAANPYYTNFSAMRVIISLFAVELSLLSLAAAAGLLFVMLGLLWPGVFVLAVVCVVAAVFACGVAYVRRKLFSTQSYFQNLTTTEMIGFFLVQTSVIVSFLDLGEGRGFNQCEVDLLFDFVKRASPAEFSYVTETLDVAEEIYLSLIVDFSSSRLSEQEVLTDFTLKKVRRAMLHFAQHSSSR